jgi:hypothetical protein
MNAFPFCCDPKALENKTAENHDESNLERPQTPTQNTFTDP